MVIRFSHPITGDQVTANLRPEAIVISPRYAESYSFDRAGRLLSLFLDDRSLQRTLDHRLLVRDKSGDRRRVELPAAERDAMLDRVFKTLAELAAVLPKVGLPLEQVTQLSEALGLIRVMGPEALAADGENYRRLFLPVSILPPDQYLALVVQATLGCSWNRCTFCGLYRDRSFRVRGMDEFRQHCQAVRDFFGAGLSLRRGLFLADANALTVPQPRLLELIRIAQDIFGAPDRPCPLFSFISAFDAQRKSTEDWAALRRLGLTRVYIGLETGDDELLRFVDKPGDSAAAIQAVRDIKTSGIAVGVIAMLGLGGDRFAARHIAGTVRAISAMPLGEEDVVYLSAYREAPFTEYPTLAAEAGIIPLDADEERAQQRALQAALRQRIPHTRVAPYHVDGFAL